MMLLDHRPTESGSEQAEALFKEARQRRRRRWLFSAIIAVTMLVLVLGVVHLADDHPHGTSTQPARTQPEPPKVTTRRVSLGH